MWIYIGNIPLAPLKAGRSEGKILFLEILFIMKFLPGKIWIVFKEQIPNLNGNLQIFNPKCGSSKIHNCSSTSAFEKFLSQ